MSDTNPTPIHIGPATSESSSVCLYSLFDADPVCGQAATTHLKLRHEDELITTSVCDAHVQLGRQAPGVVQEHAIEPACFAPDSVWNSVANRCEHDSNPLRPLHLHGVIFGRPA